MGGLKNHVITFLAYVSKRLQQDRHLNKNYFNTSERHSFHSLKNREVTYSVEGKEYEVVIGSEKSSKAIVRLL